MMFPFNFVIFFLVLLVRFTVSKDLGFTYNGFQVVNLSLDGIADITDDGLLMLTNETRQQKGQAFYPHRVPFNNSSNGNTFSFSSTFVFAIVSEFAQLSGHGMALVISPSSELQRTQASQYLGLFNSTNNGNSSNHVVAIELDTNTNVEVDDIDDNHVGIDINGVKSKKSTSAGYFTTTSGEFKNLSMKSGQPIQVWVEYDGVDKQLNVTLAPLNVPKPRMPLMSLTFDLSAIMFELMYVGFSASTGYSMQASHYVLGWSFKMNGKAQPLDLSQLPKLPRRGPKKKPKMMTIGLPIMVTVFLLATVSSVFYIVRRKRKYAEVLEDWELVYGTHRYKYKDLYVATKGFGEKELLGIGGFGRVYRGKLPTSKVEVAVKRVSHESRQGIKEFIAEIVSVGRLRHRNLVQLLGYCRRKGELLLVYEFMPNGSLDKYLFYHPKATLNWSQRFQITKGVASGLLYLHEEWEQVVVHRDVKASNVLLDGDRNGRLGDFGLAKLYDHGSNPQTTHVVGTLGYMAPELTRTGKATTSADVFSFGALLLEVACGRRPIDPRVSASGDPINLVDWVFLCWKRGLILETSDPNLGTDYVREEMRLVLELGLLCSHSLPTARPSMRQVVQYLDGDIPLPELSSLAMDDRGLTFGHVECNDDFPFSIPSSLDKETTPLSSVADSFISQGR